MPSRDLNDRVRTAVADEPGAVMPPVEPTRTGSESMHAASATGAGPDATGPYPLGSPEEIARLRRQAREEMPETLELLDRISLVSGQSAIDLACGPRGIIELLCAAVSPGGRVVGLDSDPALVAMAREYAGQRGLANAEIVEADARHTGLPPDSFDLVHTRGLLITVPDPARVVAEMVRLARPGGWIASQEPDVDELVCYPPIPALDRFEELFRASYGRSGADLLIGRRVTELYREAGLEQIGMEVTAGLYPVGHPRRTLLPDLARSLRPLTLKSGLADERELDDLDRAVRKHFADPRTIAVQHLLFVVWGRKPGVA
jgi:ubiquinone/menaquinone biosynthesis C-methylase UbiE